ncbi:MAG: Tn3 family transposase [Pseudonocardiaceae bacterium]
MKLLIRAGDRILEPHRLGLRAGEVVALRLEDLDWRNATVRVRARKTGHGALLSLPGEVGAALAGYLQHARPDTRARQVFVLHRLRVGAPISSSIVGRAVDNALRHAGMVAPMSGANLLRHSLATAVSRWSRKSSTRCASRSASCSAEGDLPTRCSTKPNNNSKALLGFDLPPRVRDFKDMIFHRPAAGVRYARIDALFGDPINWRQIEDHWRDLMRVVISIREGKLSSVTLAAPAAPRFQEEQDLPGIPGTGPLQVAFAYGCNLGAAQAARHLRGLVGQRARAELHHPQPRHPRAPQ